MKNKLIKTIEVAFIIGLCLGVASAVEIVDLFAGDSYVFELEEEYDHYSIVGNSTEIDITVTQEGNNVTITTNKYMKSDSFEIIFFNQEHEIIVEYHTSSGGGGGTTYRNRDIPIYIDKIIYKDGEEEPASEENDLGEPTQILVGWIVFGILGLAGVISFIIFLLRRKTEDNEEGQEELGGEVYDENENELGYVPGD